MKRTTCVLALAFAMSALAQQPPTNPPPYTTPPTFPQGQEPSRGMPPDTKAPPAQRLSSAQVEQQIRAKLDSEPALANAKLKVKTAKDSVILTGTVISEKQHDLALRIAQSYAGDRNILDKIEVRQ